MQLCEQIETVISKKMNRLTYLMNILESKNDSHTEELAAKHEFIVFICKIAIDIDNEAKEHNRFLDSMRFDFDTARSFIGGSSRHLGNVMSSGKGDRRFMCYIIGGIVFIFVFLYYVISSFRK
ncbi:unnamed protein product [Rotaria socialis]|uniref:t-SNARE coiled-coil homology domain-containing protein n=1 Tax=Rotaria socialis TaxID=392032 RepID=A0A821B886_9BILA|nr:unnamed protein product [Rotaria socialis]